MSLRKPYFSALFTPETKAVLEDPVAKTLRSMVALYMENTTKPVTMYAPFPLAFKYIALGMIPHPGMLLERGSSTKTTEALIRLTVCRSADDLTKGDQVWVAELRQILTIVKPHLKHEDITAQMLWDERHYILGRFEVSNERFFEAANNFLKNDQGGVVYLALSECGLRAWQEAIEAFKPCKVFSEWEHFYKLTTQEPTFKSILLHGKVRPIIEELSRQAGSQAASTHVPSYIGPDFTI